MNQRPFIRKLVYLALLVVLLVPLSLLSMPARYATPDEPGSAGGMLARLREEHKLGQANLGQIDPTSETIKLATLGMRNIAATLLWKKANDYKMREDWTAFSATTEQIIKVQPNFPTVWQFQGWNLSYNISAEFDDVRDRYFWVMKGIRFLQDGVAYNDAAPRLVWYVGWVLSQKIGVADEKVQYRRYFREDTDFHGTRPLEQRDNWLVGREWYLDAERTAERENMLEKLNPLVFLFHAPKNRINYAVSMEDEGVFEEKAAVAWSTALRDWQAFGTRDIQTGMGTTVRANDRDAVKRRIEELTAELDKFPPSDRRETLLKEKHDKLSEVELKVEATPESSRTEEQYRIAIGIAEKLKVRPLELAERVTADQREEAKKIATTLDEQEQLLQHIERAREVLNYPYWLLRCEVEREPETLEARRLVFQADTAARAQSLLEAKQLYKDGFAKWNEALKNYPKMRTDDLFGEDMMIFINRYRTLIKRMDEQFPDDFPLQDIIDAHREI
jgi:hypothetical protein